MFRRPELEKRRAALVFLFLSLLLCAACQSNAGQAGSEHVDTSIPQDNVPLPVKHHDFLVPEVINAFPHDRNAFTQGLLLFEGKFYESTGLFGRSSLREVAIESGEVIRQLAIDERYFAEGLARVDGYLWQLTWRSGQAFVYNLETFGLIDTVTYETEGWGLCFDGEALYMSDGSTNLYRRNAETFALEAQMVVRWQGQDEDRLNELECVGDYVYANVWLTNRILKIDKQSGRVVSEIDASNLTALAQAQHPDAVLNGIAYHPETGHFYLTGKLWPQLFEVRFVPR